MLVVLVRPTAQIAALELILFQIGLLAMNAMLASMFLIARLAETVLTAPTLQLHKKVVPSLLTLSCITDIS